MVTNVDWCKNSMQPEMRNIWRRRERDRCVAAVGQQCRFFLNNAIKGSIIWPVFPLCLGIMYCERRDPCITMGRGSIRCRSPWASWSKPHTSDSVYPASSAAIHFIDLNAKNSRTYACQGHSHSWLWCKSWNTSIIVRDGVFASPHQGWKNLEVTNKLTSVIWNTAALHQECELLLALALPMSNILSKASCEWPSKTENKSVLTALKLFQAFTNSKNWMASTEG